MPHENLYLEQAFAVIREQVIQKRKLIRHTSITFMRARQQLNIVVIFLQADLIGKSETGRKQWK